jgi:hypothetical protein
MLKRPAILCASLLFGAVFAFGLVRLFELRFDRGDIYPPYSTLRTDPLGASVFYESLNDVPGVTAQRYFEETFKSDDGQAHALFVLGAQPDSLKWLSRSEFATMQRFVFNGGRVVVSFYPEASEPWSARSAHTNETDSVSGDGKKPRHGHSKPDQNAVENKSETNNVAGTRIRRTTRTSKTSRTKTISNQSCSNTRTCPRNGDLILNTRISARTTMAKLNFPAPSLSRPAVICPRCSPFTPCCVSPTSPMAG